MKVKVAITQGDSNGIGYEVIIKALSDQRILEQFTPVVYGSAKLFAFYRRTIPEIEQMETNVIQSASEAKPKCINIVNCLDDNDSAEPGKSTPESAKAALAALEAAIKDIREGSADVLVTGPVNKKAMSAQGFGFPGHTEYLQDVFGVKDVAMFMVSGRIRTGVVTGHIPLKDVPSSVTVGKILGKLKLMDESLARDFGIAHPRIAVLSLNPHSGDGGLLGSEEQTTIIPAIEKANEEGMSVFGPFSPDGYFGMGNYENFDATLAMYHDQGLTPFKAIASEDGVNFTAGLPIVRTSPDHGTAFELAGQDKADARSMRAAIYEAIDIFQKRGQWDRLQENRIDDKYLEQEEKPNRQGRPQIA